MIHSSDQATADLCDERGEEVSACDLQFLQFGGTHEFSGSIETVECLEDNALLRTVISEPGEGRVLVVDGGGSLGRALFGDVLGGIAVANGWSGVVINGAVRDVAALRELRLGVTALGRHPRRADRLGTGRRSRIVTFGGVVFEPGAQLVSDEDGIVVIAQNGHHSRASADVTAS